LTLFGAAAMVVGVGFVAFGLLHVLLLYAMPQLDPASAAAGLVLYVTIGLVLVGAGIGSLQRRRWVRPVMLLASGTWILVGVTAAWLVLQLADELPLAAGLAPGDPLASAVEAITIGAVLGFGILLPGAFFWAYRDPRVLEVCERSDDSGQRPPAEVLTLSVALGATALTSLPMLARPVVPLFGHLVTGWAGRVLVVGGLVASLWLAWSTYRRRVAAYWATLAVLVLIGASTVWTFLRVDFLEVFRLLGYPEEMLARMPSIAVAARRATLLGTVAFTLGGVAYMLRLRRHFT